VITKEIINNNFSKYARSYDQYCSIQNACAFKLNDKIGEKEYSNILEIGCGTGNYTNLLINRFPTTKIKALDISQEMIEVAETKLERTQLEFIVADAELMNFDEQFDFISSNATFQWFQNLGQTLTKCYELLDKNGVILFSMFGPLTFNELNASIRELFSQDISISSCSFISKIKIKQILENIFGKNTIIEEEIIKEEHESLLELLTKIKYTGTRGNGAYNRNVWTPRTIQQLEGIYRQRYKKVVATYQVLFCRATK